MRFLLASANWAAHLHHWLNTNDGIALWLTGIATTTLAIGVLFAWRALQDARQTRHAQLSSQQTAQPCRGRD